MFRRFFLTTSAAAVLLAGPGCRLFNRKCDADPCSGGSYRSPPSVLPTSRVGGGDTFMVPGYPTYPSGPAVPIGPAPGGTAPNELPYPTIPPPGLPEGAPAQPTPAIPSGNILPPPAAKTVGR